MEQMADETTRRADVKDKGRVNTAEESSAWARGGKVMWLRAVENLSITTGSPCFNLQYLETTYYRLVLDLVQETVRSCTVSPEKKMFCSLLFKVFFLSFLFKCLVLILHFYLQHGVKLSPDPPLRVTAASNEWARLGETLEQNLKNAWHACRPYFSIS